MRTLTPNDILEISHKRRGLFYVRKDHEDLGLLQATLDNIEYLGRGYTGKGITPSVEPYMLHPQFLVAIEPDSEPEHRHQADYYPEKLARIKAQEQAKRRRFIRVVHLTPLEGRITHITSPGRDCHITPTHTLIHSNIGLPLVIHYEPDFTTSADSGERFYDLVKFFRDPAGTIPKEQKIKWE
ncbi:MAG TPA: hypothetical protein VJB87_01790 [Candidatus Nanoarchaeia archaeon]|nr:hypothetical protein [Candidatus Nanoarchaeia archaeon]